MFAIRNRLSALAAAVAFGALIAPSPVAAMIPRSILTAPANPTSYVEQDAMPLCVWAQTCRNDPVNQTDPLGLAAWADMVWGAMETAQEFYGSSADNWFTRGLVAGLMTAATPVAGTLTAADLITDQMGTFAGEVAAKDFQPTHIPVVGPVAGSIGATTAAAVEDPSLVNVSKAVGANLGGVELAFGGVMIKRGIQRTSREVQDAAPVPSTTKSDANLVAVRRGYGDALTTLDDIELNSLAAGADVESTARVLHQVRRDIGIQYKSLTPPWERVKIYYRNRAPTWAPSVRIGNQWLKPKGYDSIYGPSIKWLRRRGLSWEEIIESAKRSNAQLNQAAGLGGPP